MQKKMATNKKSISEADQDRKMDKLDILMIPLVYLIQMTLIILSAVYYLVLNPSKIGRELKSLTIWIQYICLHVLLFLIYCLYYIVQTPLNILSQN